MYAVKKDTPLPDVFTQPEPDGVTVVANRRARRLLNSHYEKPAPRWSKIKGGGWSAEYRAIQLQGDCESVVQAMLCTAHDAGMSAMFMCGKCDELHVVTDEMAKRFWFDAVAGSDGALPAHATRQ